MKDKHFTYKLNPLLISFFRVFILTIIFASAVHSQNYVTTYAGTGSPGFVNGDTSIASFSHPFGICIDPEGNLFIADAYNNCIREISNDGIVSTYAGTGVAGYLDGEASQAEFNQPINICLDAEENMYVSDFLNQRIRKITTDMMVTTLAGNGQAGLLDGPALQAKFNYPRGICLDDTGNIYIGDSWNHRIRRISTSGTVTTWAGGGSTIGVQSVGAYLDGNDTSARFYTPCELSIDTANTIFVADAYNHRIRKIDANRVVSTVAGSGSSGPNSGGFQDGPGTEARFNTPTAVYMATNGNIFVGDGVNQRVRKIDTASNVSTFAGSGETGFLDGIDSLAQFNFPRGTVIDYDLHRMYVVDYNNHAIRIIHLSSITGFSPDNELVEDFSIFPNPTSGEITINSNLNIPDLVVEITNMFGEMVYRNTIKSFPITFSLDTQKTGIYSLTLLKNGSIVKRQKLILLNH